jgi:glucose-1-phosphate cytidylyltransferase
MARAMKVVILAGGLGTRLGEETDVKPKPMVEIGGLPILWHLMKYYSAFDFNDFIVALGYKGEVIKRFFLDYADLDGNMTLSLKERRVERHDHHAEEWTVSLIDTGLSTITGGRLKRLTPLLQDSTFMMTYGDGLADVDLGRLLQFHQAHGRLATVTAVRPPARYGALQFEAEAGVGVPTPLPGDRVVRFAEKPQFGDGWINGGYFVLEPGVLDYIEGDSTHWEREPMEQLVKDGELMAYRHEGFWQSMDTLRDKRLLEAIWSGGSAPWKVWP